MPTFRLPKTDGSSSGADEVAVPPATGGRPVIDPGTGTGVGSRNAGRDAWRRSAEALPGDLFSGGPSDFQPNIGTPGDGGGSGDTTDAPGSPQATATSTPINSSTSTPTSASSMTATSTSAVPVVNSPSGVVLPVWAIVVIIVGAIMVLVFVVSLGVFCARERRKGHERGIAPRYGRAVRKALAAATGAFVPIWIAKRLCGGGRSSSKSRRMHPQNAAYAAKTEALMNHELSQASLTYTSPAAATAPEPEPQPELRPHVQRSASVVSALSSSDSARGRYSRVETDQPLADAAMRGSVGSDARAGAGLQRNPSLVSALSSTDDGRGYSAHDIPPPTPMSENAATFASPGRRRDDPAIRNSACYSP
ncbi:hypothetical protein SLS62_003265 [Diatrype stigma]|uniref:Uncharacterized protein n=1 Tax=Diatrype stigma TaxID=117547 RepID=A0AAN9UWQ7_9PEZI